jgi:DNA invertase Pin-like site-specific DNA recombinase
MANVLATFAQFERRLIGERTRAAMQAKKAAGARFGRPRRVPDRVLARVGRERESGQTFQAIAEGLNADRVPTAHGGAKWWPATIQGVLEAEYAR